ncbi:glucokinase [Mycobacterium tuberculosis T67]|nr:glucokinase [Mycobacterium tuberculosis T67]WJH79005.1 hypothetical protein FF953_03490 [Mycobacterium tuberculosis complex sp. N0145]
MSGRSRLPGSSSRRDAARIVAERVVATVAGVAVAVDEVDAAEARLRDGPRAARLLFEPLRAALADHARLDFLAGLRVVPAELGGAAGLVGAARLAAIA